MAYCMSKANCLAKPWKTLHSWHFLALHCWLEKSSSELWKPSYLKGELRRFRCVTTVQNGFSCAWLIRWWKYYCLRVLCLSSTLLIFLKFSIRKLKCFRAIFSIEKKEVSVKIANWIFVFPQIGLQFLLLAF